MDESQQLTRTERLDRLPVTPKHRRLLFGSGIGWALDAMDIGLVSFIIAAVLHHRRASGPLGPG